MSRLVIYGAGGFAREIWSVTVPERAVVFADDDQVGTMLGCPIIRAGDVEPADDMFVAVAEPASRGRIARQFGTNPFPAVRSPFAVIAPMVEIGPGAFFGHFSHVAACACIGTHLVCHVYAYIGHDSLIGDFVTVGPRASLNGSVTVGDGAYIGAGAIVRQGLTIGAGAIVGMGAVVVKDVAPGETVIGNPARASNRVLRKVS